MSYGTFNTRAAFNAGRVAIPLPTRAGLGQFFEPGPVSTSIITDLTLPPYSPTIAPQATPADSSGPATSQDIADVVNSGQADAGTAQTLAVEGATSAQMQNLAAGAVDVPTLMARLTGLTPNASEPMYTAVGPQTLALKTLRPVALVGSGAGTNVQESASPTGSSLALDALGPAGPASWGAWIQSNAWWIVGAAALIFVVPPILKKI